MSRPGVTIILFELTEALTAGGNASAQLVEYEDDGSGTEGWYAQDYPDDLEVYDVIGKYEGASGQRGWAIWRPDFLQFCIFDMDC